MPDNFNKPNYNRKQQLYVESNKGKVLPKKKNNAKNNYGAINNSQINIPNSKKTRKNKLPLFLFFALLLIVLSSTLTYASYKYFTKVTDSTSEGNFSQNSKTNNSSEIKDVIIKEDIESENLNLLLIGLDKGSLHTDTMILVNLNTNDGSVEVISIPRDTYTKLSTEVVSSVRNSQDNPIMPNSGEMKLTEVVTYAQNLELGLEILTEYVANSLDIEIDNYVAVNLKSFSYLIDEIGGVYFDVPRRMYYTDSLQNLHIDLQPGYQLLTGSQAEQLIRFRKGDNSKGSYDYPNGDLGRIETQQAFLKALIEQILSKDSIMSNLLSLGKTYYNYVTTDISLLSIPNYAQQALKANRNHIQTYSLPVDYTMINSKSYAIPIEDEVKTLIDKVFYNVEPEVIDKEIVDNSINTVEMSKPKEDFLITILNGSGISGFASRTSKLLENEGFNVLDIGDYTSTKKDHTRLFVHDKATAEVFMDYFDSAEVVYTPNQVEDLIIVLGKKETLKALEN